MENKDGGPAFPNITPDMNVDGGISKREYFAAHAVVPWDAVFNTLRIRGEKEPTEDMISEYRAVLVVHQIDALIKELDK